MADLRSRIYEDFEKTNGEEAVRFCEIHPAWRLQNVRFSDGDSKEEFRCSACLAIALDAANARADQLQFDLDAAELKVERYSITARDAFERIATTHNENIALAAERDRLLEYFASAEMCRARENAARMLEETK